MEVGLLVEVFWMKRTEKFEAVAGFLYRICL